jgi:hypothetical protein
VTQTSKPIEVNKTFIPGDPNAFPSNIIFNAGEDDPSERNPILAYEGWNFLPTGYGYKSYFGTTGELNIDSLLSRVDWILLYQRKTFENFLIALAEDGIWIKASNVIGPWTHSIVLPIPTPGEHTEWTWCVIGEDFYAYRQAGANVYRISPYQKFWIPDDPIAIIDAVITVVASTIPFATYEYYVAYKLLVSGHVAIHGEASPEVLIDNANDSVIITWNEHVPKDGFIDKYVLYRKNIGSGAVVYKELAPINGLTAPSDFSNAAWVNSNTTETVNVIAAPDGTVTADLLKEDAATSTHKIAQNVAAYGAAAIYRGSVYIKKAGRDFAIVALQDNTTGAAYAYFDLVNGLISQNALASGAGWTNVSASIKDMEDGWFLCSVQGTKAAAGTVSIEIYLSVLGVGGVGISYLGDATSGVYLWNAITQPLVYTNTDSGAGWTAGTLPLAAAIEYDSYALQTQTPNTLNMLGQLGIFKAGSRLGFWDSENSISWSGLDDKMDFVPSLTTLASAGQKFDDVIGKIVTIKQSKENFIIYSTKSIVFIQRNITEAFIWKSYPITNKTGIAYPREVTTGTVDTEHFAWTSMGLMKIDAMSFEIILAGVTDFLKESKDPVYLSLLQNRYLFLELISPDYVYGKVSFQTQVTPGSALVLDFKNAYIAVNNPSEDGCTVYNIITKIPDQIGVYKKYENIWDTLQFTLLGYPVDVDVPVYQGRSFYYSHTIDSLGSNSETNMKAWADAGLEFVPNISIIDDNFPPTLLSWNTGDLDPVIFKASSDMLEVNLDSAGPHSNPSSLNLLSSFDFNYVGVFANFVPDMLQYWYGVTRLNQAYLDSKKGLSGTVSQGVVFNDVPAALDAILTSQSTPGGTYFLFYMLALLPVEVGDISIKGSTVDLWENSTIGIATPITRWGVLWVRPVFTRTGGVQPNYTISIHWELVLDYIDVIPCDSIIYDVDEAAMLTHFQAVFNTALLPERAFECYLRIISFIKYAINGSSTPSGTSPPAVVIPDVCPVAEDPLVLNHFFGGYNTKTGKICGNPPTITAPIFGGPVMTIPASSFLLQQGSPAPLYPTFEGSLVFDTQLQKWGKQRGQFKQLLDYSPINNIASGIVPYEVFGVEGAVLKTTGKIASFDEAPTLSLIKYGKIGYTRAGFTDAEEIIAGFRRASTGKLGVTASVDGVTEETDLTSFTEFTDAMKVIHNPNSSAKWYSITLEGIFDLQYLEFKGHKKSRR